MSDATNAPALVRSVPKRGYDLGRSPDWEVPAFMLLGLPAIAFAGALIGILISELGARL